MYHGGSGSRTGSPVWTHIGMRYAIGSWAWTPYVGLLGGIRYEAYRVIGVARTFEIQIPIAAWDIAPRIGVRHVLWTNGSSGVDFTLEAAMHLTFLDKPTLDYGGGVTPPGQTAYEELRALSFGGPAIDG